MNQHQAGIDWEAETAMSEAGTGEAPWAEWNPGDPEETDPRHPGDPPWVARPRQWAAGLAVAALAAVAAVGVLAAAWGQTLYGRRRTAHRTVSPPPGSRDSGSSRTHRPPALHLHPSHR